MPTKEVTIRHSVFRWTDKDGNAELATRGQTVSIPSEAYDRALKVSSPTDPPFVPEGTSLVAPGVMTEITAEGSEEEFRAWVNTATGADIAQLLVDQPDTRDKVLDALGFLESVRTPTVVSPIAGDLGPRQPQPAGQHPLEAAHAAAEAGQTLVPGELGYTGPLPTPTVPASGLVPSRDTGSNGGSTSSTPSGGTSTLTGADQAVTGSVAQVSDYLAANPDQASAVLDAENRLVAARRAGGDTDAQPRKGVLEAVRVAAGHTPA